VTELTFDPMALAGYALAMARVGAFAASSPFIKAFPRTGRYAFTLAVGMSLKQPLPPTTGVSQLVAWAGVNIAIGLILGFLTGILLHAFEVAGALIDIMSGLNVSQVFDPLTGNHNAVMAKAFNMTAVSIWLILGGHRLAVESLAATVRLIPLDGSIRLSSSLAEVATELVAAMLRAAIELGLPSIAALFVAEVAFGLAAKFAPQANVFAIGLPAKLVAALASVGLVFAGFPTAVSASIESTRDLVVTTMRGLGA
jgi:flagellar biosynthetic protein FliR